MARPPDDRLAELTAAANDLIREIQQINADAGRQLVTLTQRSKANRAMIYGLAASFALDVILTVVLGVGLAALNRTSDRVSQIAQRLDVAQTVQRQKALCPLYQLFLDSKSPQGRKAAPDPQKYDRAFAVIEDGYRVLECDAFNKGGQTKGTP